MSEDQIKSLQSTGGDHLAATERNILGNDLERVWDTVKSIRQTQNERRIDFVLDNAGFELYCDFIYGASSRQGTLVIVVILRRHILSADLQACVFLRYHYSRLPHPEWTGYASPLSRKTVPVVRLGRDQERLGLAPEQHGLRPPVPPRIQRGDGSPPHARIALEGTSLPPCFPSSDSALNKPPPFPLPTHI